jgi:hypothetical protein
MGIVLVITGVCEIFQDVTQDMFGIKIRVHHGIIIYGVYQTINALISIIRGHQYILADKNDEAGCTEPQLW